MFRKTMRIPAMKVTADPPINPVIMPAPKPDRRRMINENNSIFQIDKTKL